ncbi:MAG TPA: hypothetical protein VJ385_02445 [Fibrobacteria bacterium]|nr:hypothetical protein [Fibrobacteria bacterium]
MNTIFKAHAICAISVWLASGRESAVSMRYMEFPVALPGAVLKMEKALDPATGKVVLKKSGVLFSKQDLLSLESQEAQASRSQLGSLSAGLKAKVERMGSSDKVRIVLHAKYPPISYPDKTRYSPEQLRASSKAAAELAPVVSLEKLAARYGMQSMEVDGTGKAVCLVGRTQLEAMKSDEDVGGMEEFREEVGASVELATLSASAYNPGSVPSGAGSGVHAATFEWGLTSSFLSCLGISATWDASTTSDQDDIRHTHAMFRTLVSTAPSAIFYHRKSLTFDGSSDVNYIIDNAIQTVSLSRSRGETVAFHSTYAEFLVMDDFAYRYPYPVFVNPASNWGYQYETNWQCYNAISVGNVRHTSNNTYELANCTQTKNPPPVYGSCIAGNGANCARDREMPHLVVPGIPSSGSDFATTCLGGSGTVGCGTSLSASIGNGIAADIIAADGRLNGWPEKVRATMILTAQNVDGGYWSDSTDGRDGSGVVSGSDAVSFAQNHTSVSPGNTATEKGMTANSIYASDFSAANKRFNYLVPNPKPSGKHLRVVLTWDSNPIVGGGTNALSDMDLTVQVNGTTQGSYSWNSNIEVVDVDAGSLTAGSSYYIDVDPFINRIPASGSRTNFFYYAIAWAWVKDHAN